MSNNKKFSISENELRYGDELREKFGEDTINKSFEKIRNVGYEDIKIVTELLNQSLLTAFKTNNPKSKEAMTACENHKNLLLMTWEDGTYSKERHLALVEGFTQDERFTQYYEKLEKGLMQFFFRAIQNYCCK